MAKYKTKIFFGSNSIMGGIPQTADLEFNDWMEEHPNIEIIKFKYAHVRYSDHSIAILYEEPEKEDK